MQKFFLAASLMFTAFTLPVVADQKYELKPVQAKLGTPIVDESFAEKEFGKAWSIAKGEWKIENGTVIGKEKASDHHAAVLSLNQPHRNSAIRFAFKFDGAKFVHLSLNHAKGHLFRVIVTPASVTITKDKDKKDAASKAIALAKAEATFEPGKWYTILVEMNGERVDVQTDNGVRIHGNHPELAVDKTGYRFITSGESIQLSQIKAWEIQ